MCVVKTLCDPLECSLPGSSVHGIFSKKYWSWLLFPHLGNLFDPGIKPVSPVSSALQANSLPAELSGKPIDS